MWAGKRAFLWLNWRNRTPFEGFVSGRECVRSGCSRVVIWYVILITEKLSGLQLIIRCSGQSNGKITSILVEGAPPMIATSHKKFFNCDVAAKMYYLSIRQLESIYSGWFHYACLRENTTDNNDWFWLVQRPHIVRIHQRFICQTVCESHLKII